MISLKTGKSLIQVKHFFWLENPILLEEQQEQFHTLITISLEWKHLNKLALCQLSQNGKLIKWTAESTMAKNSYSLLTSLPLPATLVRLLQAPKQTKTPEGLKAD